ncbi:MAG: nucleoside hydrolase, partial [Bacteroidota bacterium]
MTKKIIIDTDPGVDDAMAIQFALNSPELEVLGLSTVFGNVNLELCTENALRLLDLAGRKDIPVAAGASTPLKGPFPGGAAFVHGADGQGDTNKPKSNQAALNIPASEFLANTIKKYPNE